MRTLCGTILAAVAFGAAVAADFNVRDFGAKGDGITKDTAALQSAVDKCASAGGGRVVLSDGVFLSGAFRLRSGVDLHIDRTALELPLVSGRSGNPLKRFSFTDCTFRKVSDAELPGWERHGPAVWERVRQTTFEHVEGFTYTNTRFDSP